MCFVFLMVLCSSSHSNIKNIILQNNNHLKTETEIGNFCTPVWFSKGKAVENHNQPEPTV